MYSILSEKKQLKIEHNPIVDAFSESDLFLFFATANKNAISCNNWEEQYPAKPYADFSTVRGDKFLYVDFKVRGNYLRAVNTENLSPVAQDSCVEFFISPDANNFYFNFEFNCIGTVNASKRSERKNPTRLNTRELDSIRRYSSIGTKPFEEKSGIHSWELIVAIPLSLIGFDDLIYPHISSGNFYKCGGKTSEPHFLSWSPIYRPSPDFHDTETFGKLIFM